MITLSNIRLNNSKNRPYLSLENQLCFEDGVIYFIIGCSGTGKTSIIDFLSSPFTDEPIKNGVISVSGTKFGKMAVRNSSSHLSGRYQDFVRERIAYIPQKTDSFHPAIPVSLQLFDYYKLALQKGKQADKKEFNRLLETLSPCAGWDKIAVSETGRPELMISDNKFYKDEKTGTLYPIVDKNNVAKLYEKEFSSGQLQRILILLGLIRFHASAAPILLGDEFLVNFTYKEANDVLEKIIEFFTKEKKNTKTAIFILHDLSFDFLKNLPDTISARVIAVTKTGDTTIKANEIDVHDLFSSNWKDGAEKDIFLPFLESYKKCALTNFSFNVTSPLAHDTIVKVSIDESRPHQGIYKNINFDINRNRFIVLTGFSGCGKTTLSTQMISECFKNNPKTIRYFPSNMRSYLSLDSQVTVQDDLLNIYNYYNGINDIKECREELKNLLVAVRLFDQKNIDDSTVDEFLKKEVFNFSGGEQQRYWFMRILFDFLTDKNNNSFLPNLLVLDESIASLDCITKNEIIAYLLSGILLERKITIFLVSHDLRDINVVYHTIKKKLGANNDIFEHYEMFNHGIYKVLTPFPEYTENLLLGKGNKYLSTNGGSELILRLEGFSKDHIEGA
jgi:ABC-type glutathione transport system ATPase component